jgi:arginase
MAVGLRVHRTECRPDANAQHSAFRNDERPSRLGGWKNSQQAREFFDVDRCGMPYHRSFLPPSVYGSHRVLSKAGVAQSAATCHAVGMSPGPGRPLALIEAPSILGLRPSGVETLPEALLDAGLNHRLQARHAGRVAPDTPYSAARDPDTGVLNAKGIASFARKLADAIGDVLNRNEFPIVLGGDCSILLGGLLALRRRGRYGLLFIDGHADFYNVEANPNGEAASMDLALATGRGPDLLTNIEQRRPLVRTDDVVAFGVRDAEEQAAYGSQRLPPELLSRDLAVIRDRGIESVTRDALAHLTRDEGPADGFWIHVDADVLDDAIMPSVDYRLPGGLSWRELTHVLRMAIHSGHAVGLELTIYNPTLDPGRPGANGLARAIGDAMLAQT